MTQRKATRLFLFTIALAALAFQLPVGGAPLALSLIHI